MDESQGWATQLQAHRRHPSTRKLVATLDRLDEAIFFAAKATQLPAQAEHSRAVNWYMSAFVAALIGIRDAARTDYERLAQGALFERTPIAQEFFLSHDSNDAFNRDPIALNRAWGDIRNLRIHYARDIVELRLHVIREDLVDTVNGGSGRWFIRPVADSELKLLTRPRLSPEASTRFNEYIRTRALAEVLYHHLYILTRVVDESASGLPE